MIISLFYGFFLFIGMKDSVMIFTITHVFCSIIWVMLKYSCKETDYIFASQYWRLKLKRNESWEKILKKFYRWNTNKVDKRNIKIHKKMYVHLYHWWIPWLREKRTNEIWMVHSTIIIEITKFAMNWNNNIFFHNEGNEDQT